MSGSEWLNLHRPDKKSIWVETKGIPLMREFVVLTIHSSYQWSIIIIIPSSQGCLKLTAIRLVNITRSVYMSVCLSVWHKHGVGSFRQIWYKENHTYTFRHRRPTRWIRFIRDSMLLRDCVTILAVYKRMYENASKIALNATCRK